MVSFDVNILGNRMVVLHYLSYAQTVEQNSSETSKSSNNNDRHLLSPSQYAYINLIKTMFGHVYPK